MALQIDETLAGFTRLHRAMLALRRVAAEACSLEAQALLVVMLVLACRYAVVQPPLRLWIKPGWDVVASFWPLAGQEVVQGQVVALLLQWLVPCCALRWIHRLPCRGFGYGLGDWRFWGPLAALLLVIQLMVVVGWLAHDPTYSAHYPRLAAARQGGGAFWQWELVRLGYFCSWELLFRGYLLFALQRRLGALAVYVQTVPFVLMHMVSRKPVSEVFFTLLSGLVSGALAIEASSAWPVVILHAVGALALDVTIVMRINGLHALWLQ